MKWHAKWIWLNYISRWGVTGDYKPEKLVGILPTEKNRWGLFRKKFDLPMNYNPKDATAKLFISVDSRYKVFINEKYIGRGIYRCNRHNWYYDEYEVGQFLVPGSNIIGFIATFFGDEMSWYEPFPHGTYSTFSMGKGALIFELSIQTQNGTQFIISDKQVRGQICDAWDQTSNRINIGLPYTEIFDAHKWPEKWLKVDYDDSNPESWGHTFELHLGETWPNLILCDIPRLSENTLQPKKLVSAGIIQPFFDAEDIATSHEPGEDTIDFFLQFGLSGYKEELAPLVQNWKSGNEIEFSMTGEPIGFVFDLGKELTGFPFFEIITNAEGYTVDLGWGEKLDPKRGNKIPLLSPYRTKNGMSYKCRNGKNEYEMFHWYGMRYLQMNISGPAGKIRVKNIGVKLYLYPVEEIGTFSCNDTKLSQLYDACRWTLRNCMHDGYEDCPSREQRQWVGDAYVETMVNYALFGDTALVKKLIRQVGQSQRGDGLTEMATPGDSHIHGLLIPDYCLYWISILYEYYWYTGDKEIIIEQFPGVLRAIRWFLGYIDKNSGLLTNIPYWIFIDWSTNDKWGACCPVNAQMYHVVKQIILMAKLIGYETIIKEYTKVAERIAEGINKFLWNPTRGAYMDAVELDEKGIVVRQSKKVTFHSNALTLLYEIAPADRTEKVLRNVFDQPYSKLYIQNRNPLWTNKTPAKYIEEEHVVVAEPFFMHHINQTLAKYHLYDQIIRFLQDGWVEMFNHDATTIWETWGNFGSLCHAWCTTPAYDLATHCLGVRIIKPGAEEITIAPHLMGLKEAQGTVPTIKGPIKVRWEWHEAEDALYIHYTLLNGAKIIVQPPKIQNQMPTTIVDLDASRGWQKSLRFSYK